MRKTVIALGGGVGGLSIAHELAERGFRVQVFERKPIFGGKARSMEAPNTGKGGRRNLSGEHGFRFLPNFYKHVTDTMKRIPYPGNAAGVFGNIVHGSRAQIARAGKTAIIASARRPLVSEDLKRAATSIAHLDKLRTAWMNGIQFYTPTLSFRTQARW